MKNRKNFLAKRCLAMALTLPLVIIPITVRAEADPFGKYDPPITATFVRSTDDTLDTNYFGPNPKKTMTDNLWTDLYRDELGIIVDYDWVVKGGDEYTQKLNITLASGDIPEFLNVTAIQLKQLAEAGMIMPLDDIYEKYAAPLTKEVLLQDGSAPFDAATIDGKLYGLPNVDSTIDAVDFIWIRTDWLERCKLEVPTTMDELMNVMDVFTSSDLDGNGIDDTFGMVFTRNLWDRFAGLRGFFNAFGAYPTIWIEKDGELVYGSIQPEVKEGLALLNEMYKKGWIDKEFGVKDGGKVAESTTTSKVGVLYGAQWNPLWPLQSNRDLDPNAQWQAIPIVTATDEPAKGQTSIGTISWTVVRKNVKNPEAVVKMFNLFIDKNWGEDNENGIYYAPLDSESIWKLSPVVPTPPYKNLNCFIELDEAREKGSFKDIQGEALSILKKLETYESGSKDGFALWGWERIYGVDGAFKIMKHYSDNDLFVHNKFVGAPTETMTERMTTLTTLQDEIFTKIILGEAPIDDFDKFVKDFNTLGGAKITAEVNEWYKSVK